MNNWKDHAEWALSLLTTIGVACLASGSPLIGPRPTLYITLGLAISTAVIRFLNTDTAPVGPSAGGISPSAKVAVLVLFVVLSGMTFSGCKAVNAPLPPGALSPADATIDATLAAGTAAVNQYETDVKAGFVPTVALKKTMQGIQQSLAIAIPAYQAWHAALATVPSTPQPAALSTAVSNVNAGLQSLPSAAN